MPPIRLKRQLPAILATSPAILVVLVVYVGCTIWSARTSFTASALLPSDRFIGLRQYESLFSNARWEASAWNLLTIGVLYISITVCLGMLLAILIDRKIRGEAVFRTIYLYPYSMSFVVTGLVWQWLLNPTVGIEKLAHDFGFASVKFDWIVQEPFARYCVVAAAVWHGAGLVMAISLAGLRGIDEEIWKAARIDGIPTWRTYVSIVLPMLGASLATATVLLTIAVVRLYDLVVAMTNGGPGLGSEVPAKFIVDHLFDRQNIGLATAAATIMLITVLAVIVPLVYAREVHVSRGRG